MLLVILICCALLMFIFDASLVQGLVMLGFTYGVFETGRVLSRRRNTNENRLG